MEFRLSEADTCRHYVLPNLAKMGWDNDRIAEQRYITDGKITIVGKKHIRQRGKKPDYILLYTPDYPIAVIEAKAYHKLPSEGLGQAMEYAEMLGVSFAYSTNGKKIVEYDYTTGKQRDIDIFPTPDELWERLSQKKKWTEDVAKRVIFPHNREIKSYDGKIKRPRYYQEIAINRACEAIFIGKKRILLTMATGTGKTFTAFQIIWKVWEQRWNKRNDNIRPKILYLADRNILIDQPKREDFSIFGDACIKVKGDVTTSRDIYLAIYQAIAENENNPGLYKKYPQDFFDLIVIDECHRGSAADESNWRSILEYFHSATQLGMTATPKIEENINTYNYFGEPVYTYSLRQGIEDGFLAPYKVKRVVTNIDAEGLRLPEETKDKFGNVIPDKVYKTKHFERVLSVDERNDTIAKYIVNYLYQNGIEDNKTILFCVNQDHALIMRDKIRELIPDILSEYPHFCERVTSDEGYEGRKYLDDFKEAENYSIGILTSSDMLTTGVDMPTVKTIVLFRVINSIVTFKQTIGRGTRLREDKDKLWFTIIDFTGATDLFANDEFDPPDVITETEIINEDGNIETTTNKSETKENDVTPEIEETIENIQEVELPDGRTIEVDPEKLKTLPDGRIVNIETGVIEYEPLDPPPPPPIRKYYIDGVNVSVVTDSVYMLDANGKVLRTVEYTEYVNNEVRKLFTSASMLETRWTNDDERMMIVEQLKERGIVIEDMQEITGNRDADPFDLLMHIAYNRPLKTRREKANRVQREYKAFFEKYKEPAREILSLLLDKYTEFGSEQLLTSDIFEVPPLNNYGTPVQIFKLFGSPEKTREAVNELYALIQKD